MTPPNPLLRLAQVLGDPPALPWWLVAIGYLTCAGSLGICAATAVLVVFRLAQPLGV